MRLTKPQRAFLEHANRCTPPHPHAVRHDFSGASARGVTLRCTDRLQDLGLITYIGHGMPEDEDVERPIYAITDAGRAALPNGNGNTPKEGGDHE